MSTPVFVYVIGAPGMPLVKIGKSTDPVARLGTLQTGCPMKLELVAILKPNVTEYQWHKKFRDQRRHGEWFFITNEMVEELHALDLPESAARLAELMRLAELSENHSTLELPPASRKTAHSSRRSWKRVQERYLQEIKAATAPPRPKKKRLEAPIVQIDDLRDLKAIKSLQEKQAEHVKRLDQLKRVKGQRAEILAAQREQGGGMLSTYQQQKTELDEWQKKEARIIERRIRTIAKRTQPLIEAIRRGIKRADLKLNIQGMKFVNNVGDTGINFWDNED